VLAAHRVRGAGRLERVEHLELFGAQVPLVQHGGRFHGQEPIPSGSLPLMTSKVPSSSPSSLFWSQLRRHLWGSTQPNHPNSPGFCGSSWVSASSMGRSSSRTGRSAT
jgi:hypothetical protein